MLKRAAPILFALSLIACTGLAAAQTPQQWVEGKNYFRIDNPQPVSTPGKIEVVEVFSYACPVCWRFLPYANQIRKDLPANAEMVYVPASFRPDEDWPVFQRAFYAARALGVEDKTHDAMFKAIWGPDGELATYDMKTNTPKHPGPQLPELAKFYAKYGVKPADFIGVANSFAVNLKMKRADTLVKNYGVDGTPTMIVNGKWRFDMASAGGPDQTVQLAKYLVAREAAAAGH